MFRLLIRYAAYPVVAVGAAILLVTLATQGIAYWPAFPMIVVASFGIVATLERIAPYEPVWNNDHGDTRVDILHLLTSHALIQSGVAIAFGLRLLLPNDLALWPASWPMWAQVLLAGAIMDLGLYSMHRWSHVQPFLWRLHVLHHSPERLYWLNGGRRHPLSALALAGPGLLTLLALGATPIAVGAWMSIMSVHLAFQHANLDYRLGPFRHLLGVGELHRWHHKRDYEDAQVNFGEVWMIWDRLFGTYHDAPQTPRAGEVGLRETRVPNGYWAQLCWPWAQADSKQTVDSGLGSRV
jgi:sterol desaturase/sphingolipid hydroxylase (fatty acid hydroxylase superfamily)